MIKKWTLSLLMLCFSASMLMASGFSIYEQGAKATAMGGAFIAQANDVTGVFYNPAGITALPGFNVSLGTTIIIPAFDYTGPQTVDPLLYTKSKDLVFPPTHFYLTYKINEKLSAGFGFYTLFGLGSEWPEEWVGRQLATNSHVQTYFFNPVVSYKLMDNLSVAAGFSAVMANVTLEKSILTPVGYWVESKLDATTMGYGFNLGLQYKPMEKLSLGLVYRHNVKLDFKDGDATFTMPAAAESVLRPMFPNTTGDSELTLPQLIGVGIAYDFTEQLTAEFDFMQLNWSSYDVLKLKFKDPVGGSTESEAIKNYEDSYSLRVGMEYRINEQWAARLGYLRDNEAVPDEYVEPSLPEGPRHLFCFGAGFKINKITIDGFYLALLQDDREIKTSKLEVNGQSFPFNGKYRGLANMFGLTVSYGF
ncbi:MAG: transporter [Calditrichaceae bacterium]|nr:transporter [Calditrichaceae bacterium]MBN2708281.1 transporter [Calditrichaceae bacterium]RQV91923.1 MAG: transporter [Calditrichota bacterium]